MKNILTFFIIAVTILSVTVPLNSVDALACPSPAQIELDIREAEINTLTAKAAAIDAQTFADAGNAEASQASADSAKRTSGSVNAFLDHLRSYCDLTPEQLIRLLQASSDATRASQKANASAAEANNAVSAAPITIEIYIEIIKVIIEIIIIGLLIIIVIVIIRISIRIRL